MLLVTVCYDVQGRHPTTTHAALILFGIYRIAGNIGGLKLWWFCPKLTEKIFVKFKFGSRVSGSFHQGALSSLA